MTQQIDPDRQKEIAAYIGKTLFVSDWFTIDEDHLKLFAQATYLEEAQVDLTMSRNNPLGATLVDGFMSLSLLVYFGFKYSPLVNKSEWAFNYGLNRVRFITPVMIGQPIRLHAKVLAVEPHASGGLLVTTENTLELEGAARPAMVAEMLALHFAAADEPVNK